MDSSDDGSTLGTTAGSDCCCYWYDILAQNQQERYSLLLYLYVSSRAILLSTVDRTDLADKGREKECVYDEVKPCVATAISLKSNIAYSTTVEHTSVL